MPLNNGHFRTEAGSSVDVSGEHHGIYDIWFDWFEEGACIEAVPYIDNCGARLGWQCECHGYFDVPLQWGGVTGRRLATVSGGAP